MPLFQYILSDYETQIAVWKISESEEELKNLLQLSDEQTEKYNSLSSKRRLEYLGTRACLKHLGINHRSIQYQSNGKPFVDKETFISLSHSHGMAAVAISNQEIGVDIELKRNDKIKRIKHKFVREDEFLFITPKKELDYLQVIWGIKESLYKIHGGGLFSFINHYKVESFDTFFEVSIPCSVIEAENTKHYLGYYYEFSDYYLTFVLNNY